MNFPDTDYITGLIAHLDRKVAKSQSNEDRLLMLSGASMNWIADFFTDPTVAWSLEMVALESLVLTGTNPVWNEIVIIRAERSPVRLKALLEEDVEVRKLFSDLVFTPEPILVRVDEGLLKVLDGMHRVLACIRDGRASMQAYIARSTGQPKPYIEAHVVYDLLKAYHRGLTHDRAGLVAALRYLRGAYVNVDMLLRKRFTAAWVPSSEIQSIIDEALQGPI